MCFHSCAGHTVSLVHFSNDMQQGVFSVLCKFFDRIKQGKLYPKLYGAPLGKATPVIDRILKDSTSKRYD